MKPLGTIVALMLVVAGIVVPPILMSAQMRHTRHFATVRPGVLYRGGQPTVLGLKRILHDHRIRTIVCLRDESQATAAEEAWCSQNEVRFVRIQPLNWDGTPGAARVDKPLRRFLEVMEDPANHPVLVHCFAGTHRTGGFVAVWRMEAEGWSSEQAKAELRGMGYVTLDSDLDISQYLNSYQRGALATTTAKRE